MTFLRYLSFLFAHTSAVEMVGEKRGEKRELEDSVAERTNQHGPSQTLIGS